MVRKKLIIILTLAIAILLVGLLIYSMMQPGPYMSILQGQLTPDYRLLCDVLRPGMSEEEVLTTLKSIGDFTINRGTWGDRMIQIGINYSDPEAQAKYGFFYLLFIDNGYVRAGKTELVGSSGEKIIICDFQPTVSLTIPTY
jgi:hypothetical protein